MSNSSCPAASRRATATKPSPATSPGATAPTPMKCCITTPLGAGVARIVREGKRGSLTTAEPREYRAATPKRSPSRCSGFACRSPGWPTGCAARPSATHRRKSASTRHGGRLRELEQRGWKIDYLEYEGDAALAHAPHVPGDRAAPRDLAVEVSDWYPAPGQAQSLPARARAARRRLPRAADRVPAHRSRRPGRHRAARRTAKSASPASIGEDNLCVRAARLLKQANRRPRGCRACAGEEPARGRRAGRRLVRRGHRVAGPQPALEARD